MQDTATPPASLSHPAVRRYLATRMLSGLASQMVAVAVGWQIYDLTGSTWSLGLVGLAGFLPMALLTLPAGHVADRFDRRAVAGCCQAMAGAMLALLAWGSWAGWVTPGWIYVAVSAGAAARAFERPALGALLPGLVPAAIFPRASALSVSMMQTSFILGPSLGGLLYGLGPAAPYAVAAIALAGAAGAITRIRLANPLPRTPAADLGSVLSGIHFIRKEGVVLGAISLDLFAVLLGGATALLPVYARDILHAGPWGLGLLRAAPALGAVSLSAILARRPLRRRVGRTMFAAVIVFGVGTIVFALSRSIVLSVAALFTLGAADVVSVVVRQTLVQLRTPDAMRGRVGAVNGLFIGTSNQLGEFESGITAALIGAVPAVLVGGIGTIAVALLWMRLFPALRRMDQFEGPAPAA